MRNTISNTIIVLLTLLVCLVFGELALRRFVPLRDVGPSFTVHDPVLGKRVKPGFSTERITPEFRMRFTSNSLGFRGPETHDFAMAPLLFLGDSFTLGYGVNDGEEYPALVAAELRRRYGEKAPSVVNAGIGDSGNGFWLRFLQTRGQLLRPRLVAMQVFQNDFSDNLNEGLYALAAHGTLHERPVPAPGLLRRLQPAIEAIPFLPDSHLLGLVRQVRLPELRKAHADVSEPQGLRPSDELTLRIIERAITMCAARGWQMLGIVVGLPEARRNAVNALFARHGVRTVILPEKSARPDLYYVLDGHWNSGGHALAASAVVEALESLGVVSR